MTQVPVRRGDRDFLVFLGPDGRVTSIRVLKRATWRGYWQSWSGRPMRRCDQAVAALALEHRRMP
jgi:hypothetical protein